MIQLHHKHRWVLTPVLENGKPLVAEYTLDYVLHLAHSGKGLAYCEFNVHGLAAAQACTDLHVFPSIHSAAPIHADVVAHYGAHGVQAGMSQHDALLQLAKHHGSFEPPE